MGLLEWVLTLGICALLVICIRKLFKPKQKPVVEGYFHPKFKRVADKLRENVESGKERGCAFAVYYHGEPLIDMWAGYADPAALRPWSKDTMAVVFSATKGIAGLTLARMVEKGWLDYDKPVAHYWPEFGQNGKENITVEQLISHQAGLIACDKKINLFETTEDHENHHQYLHLLETATPFWKPGTAHGYHGATYGLYVDVLVKKADPKHRNMSQFFQEEVATPFDVDFHIGVPKQLFYRVARGHYMSLLENLIRSVCNWNMFRLMMKMIMYPESATARGMKALELDIFKQNAMMSNPDFLSIGVSSFTGAGTARGIAKLYSYLADGGQVKGKRFLSEDIVHRLLKPVCSGHDQVVIKETTWGLGLTYIANTYDKYKGQTRVGHPGYGGNVGGADPTNGLSMAYITNFPSIYGKFDDPRYLDLEELLYDCFDKYVKDL